MQSGAVIYHLIVIFFLVLASYGECQGKIKGIWIVPAICAGPLADGIVVLTVTVLATVTPNLDSKMLMMAAGCLRMQQCLRW